MRTKPLAFAYVRFSSEKQSAGSSADRQITRAKEYAIKHGLELDDTTYHDLGVSAYRGKNAVEGKLSKFIAAVEDGRIPKGSYLLVENFDRMSRNVLSEAQALLLNLINRGVIVVTLLDEQVFSKEIIDGPEGTYKMILALLEMIRARGESARKADLVSKGWTDARKNKKIFTRMAPAWLSTKDGETWIVNKERVEVVKRIFKMAQDEGLGTPTIARKLDADHVPRFGTAPHWTAGVVAHILKNKAVIGTLETAKAGTMEGYYPAIIKREVFDTVNSLMPKRNFAPSPRSGGNIGNIFAGRSYCGVCGAKMKSVSQHATGLYIHCSAAYRGNGECNARRVAYHSFEAEILMHLINGQHRSLFRLDEEVAVDPTIVLRHAIEEKQRKIESALDSLIDLGKNKSMIDRLHKLEAERDALLEKLRTARPVPKTHSVLNGLRNTYLRFNELQETDRESEEYKSLRSALQVGLRTVIAKVEFHHEPGDDYRDNYRVTFASGTVRERQYRRQAKGFQPGNKNGKR